MRELDLSAGAFIGPEIPIWTGYEDPQLEMPHIFKLNGWYYLFCAEGGTWLGHMETCARSRSLTGPYESCPHNPILSHRQLIGFPLQTIGHADLVQSPDGKWWTVFLGTRHIHYDYHTFGREIFLAPLEWDEQGWPVVNGGRPIECVMDTDDPPPFDPGRTQREIEEKAGSFVFTDRFDGEALEPGWMSPSPVAYEKAALSQGGMTLTGTGGPLDAASAILGRRLGHFTFTCSAELTSLTEGGSAGLTLFAKSEYHYEIVVENEGGAISCYLNRQVGDMTVRSERVTLGSGLPVKLEIKGERNKGSFFANGRELATGQLHFLSAEVASGYQGVILSMHCMNGEAQFSSFTYTH